MKLDIANLNKLSDAELRSLNSAVVALLKQRSVINAQMFSAGQKVEFKGKYGSMIQGVVTKVKVKMIEVDAGKNGRWNVNASLLKVI